jgi:hypothetical protein
MRQEVQSAFEAEVTPVLLRKMVSEWPAIRRKHFRPDCCVNATRVWIEAVHLLMPHAKAKPLTVDVLARNREARALMDRGSEISEEEWRRTGARLIAIDKKSEQGEGWNGHVVVIFNGKTLIDPSSEQLSRPKLHVPPVVVVPVNSSFLSGKTSLMLDLPNEGELIYEAHPRDESFKRFSGFQPHEGNIEAAVELVRAVKRS